MNKVQGFCIHLFLINHLSFGQLLNISPENFMFLKTFDSEFSHIDLWFTYKNSKPVEIEDKINITWINLSIN